MNKVYDFDAVLDERHGKVGMPEVNLMPSQWEVGDTASKAAMTVN